MKISVSLELIWQLAGQEAAAAEFAEIEPEHFCLGLLKFSEVPASEVKNVAREAGLVRELAAEITVVNEALVDRSIDSTRVRRALRTLLGRGTGLTSAPEMHRSKASRRLWSRAGRLVDEADSDVLAAIHLLEAVLDEPTDLIAQVIGDTPELERSEPGVSPLLQLYGQNLACFAGGDEHSASANRTAETKALAKALSKSSRQSVFLMSDDDEAVKAVVTGVAQLIGHKDCPKALKGKRIIQVTASNELAAGGSELLGQLLDEARTSTQVVLYLPSIDSSFSEEATVGWCATLKGAMTKGNVQCLWRISLDFSKQHIESDVQWRKLAHVMWIHQKTSGEIPDEL